MTLIQALETLKKHNKLRCCADDIEMEDPQKIGEAIDIVISKIENYEKVNRQQIGKQKLFWENEIMEAIDKCTDRDYEAWILVKTFKELLGLNK